MTAADHLTSGQSGMPGLDANDNFSAGLDVLGDTNGDGVPDLLAGARLDDDTAANTGAIYLLELDPCPEIITNPIVYESPSDNGVFLCVPTQLATPGNHTLHLYVKTAASTTANPADVCVEDTGDGSEMCAWDVRVVLEGGATIQSFAASPPSGTPPSGQGVVAPPADLDWEVVSPTELRANWLGPGTPSNPGAGPIKIGDLVVTVTGSANERVRFAQSVAVGAGLELQRMADRVVALPEPGTTVGLSLAVLVLLGLARRRRARGSLLAGLLLLGLTSAPAPASAQLAVKTQVNLLQSQLENFVNSWFGSSVASLGAFNGVPLVLAIGDEDSSANGRVWVAFLDRDFGVVGFRRLEGDVAGQRFGNSIANAGDLDGDGIDELLVGARLGGSATQGSVRILRFNDDGTEKLPRKIIDDANGGLTGPLDVDDRFGGGLAGLGDVDNDTLKEIAVGAFVDDDGATDAGAVYLLSIDPVTLEVVYETKLSAANPPLDGLLTQDDRFGFAIEALGDLDGPGGSDFAIAVGAPNDCGAGTCGSPVGGFYVLFLQGTGAGGFSIVAYEKITQADLPFGMPNALNGTFGRAFAWQPIPEGTGMLYVGGGYANAGTTSGASGPRFWPLHLRSDGTVRDAYAFSHFAGVGFTHPDPANFGLRFGNAIAVLPDARDEDPDLVVADREKVPSGNGQSGAVFLFERNDTDHDGLDDVIDNCVSVHNPQQADADDDGVGDLCDNCVDVANAANLVATDCNGDTGTRARPSASSATSTTTARATCASPWSCSSRPPAPRPLLPGTCFLQCGAFDVTDVNAAIVLPAGSTATPRPSTLSTAPCVGELQSITGPGLSSPQRRRRHLLLDERCRQRHPRYDRLCAALDRAGAARHVDDGCHRRHPAGCRRPLRRGRRHARPRD